MKLSPCFVLVVSVALATGCGVRTPIYRADVKLLVGYSQAKVVPLNERTRADEERFFASQIDTMSSQTMLKRVQSRMKKTVKEVRNYLTDLKVAPVPNSSITVISVDSPSPEFAKGFANALADEYLRLRDEERVKNAEEVLKPLTAEVKQLTAELKAIDEKLAAFYTEHDVSRSPELQQLKALYEKREQVQKAYSVAAVLETASIEPNPVCPKKR
jgi:uncharacterized protein involved in exopolysaccharide biosynthesis